MSTGNPTFGISGPLEEEHGRTEGEKDLQKEFDRLKKGEDKNTPIKFLVENFNRNPGYVRKQTQILLGTLGMKMEEWSKMLFQASVRKMQADLYKAFRDLSERQKTKIGGFPGFVKQELGDLIGDGQSAEEQRFIDAVLSDAKRQENFGSHYLMDVDAPVSISGRPNYKKEFEKSADTVGSIAERIQLIESLSKLVGTNE